MKKSFSKIAIVTLTAFAFIACNNQPKQNDTVASKNETTTTPASDNQKVAYVEIDSIMSQYTYWKDVTKIIKAKGKHPTYTCRKAESYTGCSCKLPAECSSKQIYTGTGSTDSSQYSETSTRC